MVVGGTGLGWQQDFLRLDSESRPSEPEVFYFNDYLIRLLDHVFVVVGGTGLDWQQDFLRLDSESD